MAQDTAAQPPKSQYAAERERVDFRREQLQLPAYDPIARSGRPWGLALSGGGIRSATFCLGVLQAMARSQHGGPTARQSLLARFDYLSTVSGGGYIGGFFSSLFLPDRLRGQAIGQAEQTPLQAAEDAYEVFVHEPPGKISTARDYTAEAPGSGPGAWLRENGRYLTPTGGGDTFYTLAMAWRNWLSLHFVIGMPLVLGLAVLFVLQVMLGRSLFVVPITGLVVLALPCALAYWLIIPDEDLDKAPNSNNLAFKATAGVAVTLLVLSLLACIGDSPRVAMLILCLATVAAGGLGMSLLLVHRLAALAVGNSVRDYRVQVTRWLSWAMIAVLASLLLAAMATLAEEVYCYLFGPLGAASLGVLPALIWLVRRLALLKDEKALPGWMSKLPLEALALIGALLVGMLICLGWALLVLWIGNGGRNQTLSAAALPWLAIVAGLAAALAVVAGRFVGFLNTSSLHNFYASRLTRAYLGASNGKRFSAASGVARRAQMSVAEPLPDDDIALERFYGTRTAGPVHLINVTMNLTVDPAEQLVQRDRKGKPLCLAPYEWLAPGARSTSFILDGISYQRDPNPAQRSEIMLPLTLGQWIGTSGAAFSTGLGRATSLGLSLALGLANVRLGVWWPSQFLDPGHGGAYQRQDSAWAQRLSTQTYLFYEFTAHFHGHRRDLQYLSDGGHFENTGAYELLRVQRDIELIVLCDCGCDPAYRFEDLANLVRLARIDHQLEIREDTRVCNHPVLGQVFGSIEYFQQPKARDSKKCALLFDVFDKAAAGGETPAATPRCRILVLKPRLIPALTADVLNYALANPAFPNQATIDQFFDEAQFESYRQLGLRIGQTLFGAQSGGRVGESLWRYLHLP